MRRRTSRGDWYDIGATQLLGEDTTIGKKKLSEIQADVAEAFAKQGLDPQQWFASRIEKLQDEKPTDEREVEALKLLRNAIASADERELDPSR